MVYNICSVKITVFNKIYYIGNEFIEFTFSIIVYDNMCTYLYYVYTIYNLGMYECYILKACYVYIYTYNAQYIYHRNYRFDT